MKKYILKSLFVSMLCMLAASCQDTELAETLETTNAQVMFSLAMDSQSARSRSTWDDYKPTGLGNGTYYDNKIDYDQFIVKIEAKGTTYNVIDIVKSKKGKPEEGKYNEYNFVGTVQTLDGKNVGNLELTNAKISVYVNMGKKNISETFDQGAEYMPMFGFHTANLNFAPGKREEVETPIYLLRAMAKIEVALNEEMAQDYTLSAVTLNKYNEKGNSLPTIPTDNDGKPSVQNTKQLDQEEVFNVNQSAKDNLRFVKNETNASWSVYLPEVKNNSDLEITVVLQDANGNEETGKFNVMDYNYEEPLAMDIVRNHWYKYTISGFAESEIQVQYNTLDWQPEKIEIGGDGFLFLNKDVIEIYNSNIDADQLTFASSSPIESIELVDKYLHRVDGNIVEGTVDGFSAYYISKFGQKIQLGTDPLFDIPDKDATLAREAVILNNISATPQANVLNGGITIYSPFIADPENEIVELQQDSHFDTPRYLEFLVTNTQGQKATFRVVQYPAVVITNEEGFFSYRDDFCEGHHELGTNKAPTHYLNCQERAYVLAFLQNTEIHQVDPLLVDKFGNDYGAISTCPGAAYTFKELLLADGGNGGWYKSSVYPYGEFIRKFYVNMGKESQNQLVGVPYRDENYVHPSPSAILQDKLQAIKGTDRDFWWRKHYTGNMIEFFMSKVIKQVYRDGIENNGEGYKRLPGQADIYHHMPDGKGGWRLTTAVVNVNTMQFNNNRMYHIKTQHMSDKFIIGYPEFVANDSVLIENKTNANLVSPSFMVASQLGTTEMPVNDHPGIYEDASPQIIYDMAKIHCKQYVEAKFEDTNGNGKPEPELGEKVTYYRNWRLPTKAEIDLIIEYQNSSRAMDVLLTGQRYACVTGEKDQLFSDQVDGYVNKGYFMRCVRDVKPDEN